MFTITPLQGVGFLNGAPVNLAPIRAATMQGIKKGTFPSCEVVISGTHRIGTSA
jgi:hypothetical protein